jgi:TIR domain/Pentapeptide repeats (8 copies)
MAEERPTPPESAEELLRRLQRGRVTSRTRASAARTSAARTSAARAFRGANLSVANLRGANLSDANLSTVDLRVANLSDANLRGADLSDANLSNADLVDVSLRGANLVDAKLRGADLRGADLRGANLRGANLGGANLSGANLSSASLHGTLLLQIDLSPLCDADPPVMHFGASTVDFRAIVRSLRSPNLKDFLQRTGMPEVFVEYDVSCALSLETKVFAMLQSTFISYGSPDEPFARKLYEALHRNGVTAFFFAEHAVPGDKLHRMMRKGVNEHDREILVCSRASLDRKGVLNEIEETLARESRDGGAAYLIPIRLDGYVFSGWTPPNPDAAQAVRDRVVADFEGADTDPEKFSAALLRLIAALKK